MKLIRQIPAELAPHKKTLPQQLSGGSTIAVRLPNWLGDAVMAMPAVKQLTRSWQKVVAVVPPQIAELANRTEGIAQVVVLNGAHSKWLPQDIENLHNANAEAAILFNNSLRDAWYFRKAGVRNLYGAAARGRSILMKKAFRFPKIRKKQLNFLHHSRKYAALAASVSGGEWSGEFPALRIDAVNYDLPVNFSGKILLLAPGAAYGAAKRWPANLFSQTAKLFLQTHPDGLIVIVGAAPEAPIAAEVAQNLPPEQVKNLCGATDFNALAAWLKRADVCVANDSGTMHLAAMLGTPGVAMFGPTDYASTAPVSKDWILIYSEFPCAPCFKRQCPKFTEPACMRAISAESVAKALETLL